MGHVIDGGIGMLWMVLGIVLSFAITVVFGKHVTELQDRWDNKHYEPFRRKRAFRRLSALKARIDFLTALGTDAVELILLLSRPVALTCLALLLMATLAIPTNPLDSLSFRLPEWKLWRAVAYVMATVPYLLIGSAFSSWLEALYTLRKTRQGELTKLHAKFRRRMTDFEEKWPLKEGRSEANSAQERGASGKSSS